MQEHSGVGVRDRNGVGDRDSDWTRTGSGAEAAADSPLAEAAGRRLWAKAVL